MKTAREENARHGQTVTEQAMPQLKRLNDRLQSIAELDDDSKRGTRDKLDNLRRSTDAIRKLSDDRESFFKQLWQFLKMDADAKKLLKQLDNGEQTNQVASAKTNLGSTATYLKRKVSTSYSIFKRCARAIDVVEDIKKECRLWMCRGSKSRMSSRFEICWCGRNR